jgi:NAD(P)-dependent dehydrogenase (short-subunit alcohol dehydrogenase family)
MLDNAPDEDGERGVIINTSSVAGEDGTACMPGYAATKAALIGMTLPAAPSSPVAASASIRSSQAASTPRSWT